MTSTVIYEGELRTVATHLQSGTEIETDAPVDNQGKGERFSPTDLVATALGACMATTMGTGTHTIDRCQGSMTRSWWRIVGRRKLNERTTLQAHG